MKKSVSKTTQKSPKYVTEERFDEFAVSVAKSFANIDKRFENLEGGMSILIKQMQTMNEESREHRLAMSALTHSDVKQERNIDELFERVEKIERKIAIK